MFTGASFENQLLREFTKKTTKRNKFWPLTNIWKKHIVEQTKQQLKHNINQHVEVWITRKQMRPLDD